MFSAICGMTVFGLQAWPIRVEVDVSNGLPSFDIVGLATPMVREARERVRSALRNNGSQTGSWEAYPSDLYDDGSFTLHSY